MATRTRKTTAKKTATRKAASSKPATPTKPGTVTQLRPPLATRRRSAADPYTPEQMTEARAALASAMAALPVPVLAWQVPAQTTSHRAAAHLTDGTVITHVAHRRPVFNADITCNHGARHTYTITTAGELADARKNAATCTIQHAGDSLHEAIARGPHTLTAEAPTTPIPNPAVRALGDGLKRAKAAKAAATDETQPLSQQDIADGIAARTADTETPKEHPQP